MPAAEVKCQPAHTETAGGEAFYPLWEGLPEEAALLRDEAESRHRKYLRHVEQHGANPIGEARAERREEVEGAVIAMQRMYLSLIEFAEAFPQGAPERRASAVRLLSELTRDVEFWDAEAYAGVVLWLRHMIGRAWATAGEPERAYAEGFDPIIREAPRRYPPGEPRAFVDSLRMVAFYLKAKTAFDCGDNDTVIKTVDDMFAPETGYPHALSDDRGSGAAMLRDKAYLRRRGPELDAEEAVEEW